ncbi:MAG: D-alanyl-D-alanine carboxypeptidase family protein [Bifidobacteriaceae bacterium]|jgi:LAS superfamily LD-carboxypeptidase LdcB|nr:D-alanyl-D-alanine carboxypeptidase family protein [Bifidobacteriaceae bacterium]
MHHAQSKKTFRLTWIAPFSAISAGAVAIFMLAAPLSGPVATPAPPDTSPPIRSSGLTTAEATAKATTETTTETSSDPGDGLQDRDGADQSHAPGPLPSGNLSSDQARQLSSADGILPAGATIFDEGYPGVGNLDRLLLAALQRAAVDSGLSFHVSSGWRSQAYQAQLLEQAVITYGSEAEAIKWVAPPGKSLHVAGQAVDLGGPITQEWLAKHGPAYGLCLAYGNEPWHFELRSAAPTQGCPRPYRDASEDPRLK